MLNMSDLLERKLFRKALPQISQIVSQPPFLIDMEWQHSCDISVSNIVVTILLHPFLIRRKYCGLFTLGPMHHLFLEVGMLQRVLLSQLASADIVCPGLEGREFSFIALSGAVSYAVVGHIDAANIVLELVISLEGSTRPHPFSDIE